jgi:hypothetical protein
MGGVGVKGSGEWGIYLHYYTHLEDILVQGDELRSHGGGCCSEDVAFGFCEEGVCPLGKLFVEKNEHT